MIDRQGKDSLALTRSEASVEQRITWTLPALVDATSVVLQIKGEAKADVLLDAVERLAAAESDEALQRVRCEKPIAAMISYRSLSVCVDQGLPPVERPLTVFFSPG